ncbi:MAG: Npt1/Npt2 family nucleotide transporter [Deinococcota bacterium]
MALQVLDIFRNTLNIRVGETQRVVVMVLFSAATGANYIVSSTVASALFLSQLPEALTPFLYILPPIPTVILLLVYSQLASRNRLDHLVIGSSMVFVVACLVFRLLLETPIAASFALLASIFIVMNIMSVLLIMQFWTIAGQIFDPREAKRLFGLIAVGDTFAGALAGLTLGPLAARAGVNNLMYLVALTLIVAALCARTLGRSGRLSSQEQMLGRTQRARSSFWQDILAIRRTPLLVGIVGLTVLLAMLISTSSYQFFLALQTSFVGQEERIVSFLGAYALYTGIGAFVMQSYVTNLVMKRLGLFTALLFFPLGIIVGSFLVFMTGGTLLALAVVRAVNPVIRDTINEAGLNLLYLPVAAQLRQRSKELFEIVYAVSAGLFGISFLISQNIPNWRFIYWSYPLLVFALLWVLLVWWTRRQYQLALSESVKRRVLNLENSSVDIRDEATIRVLRATLNSSDDLQVVQALMLISSAGSVDWDSYLEPLLLHSSSQVRVLALKHLGRAGNTAYSELVMSCFDDPDDDTKAAAIEAFCAISGHQGIAQVGEFLKAYNPKVKGAAMVGLIRYGGLDGILQAATDLKDMLASPEAAMRQEAANVLGRLRVQTFYEPLIRFFDDPDLEVRRSAIRAAGDLASLELLPYVLDQLQHDASAGLAAEALVKYGEVVVPQLRDTLLDSDNDPNLRARIPAILQQLGSAHTAGILLEALEDQNSDVRYAVLQALDRLHAMEIDFVIDDEVFDEAIFVEMREAYRHYVMRVDLGPEGSNDLLVDALESYQTKALERLFFLLDMKYPEFKLEPVRHSIESNSADKAIAIELLDNVLDRDDRDALLPLLEAPEDQVLEAARKRFEITSEPYEKHLLRLSSQQDKWLRSCAILQLGELGRAELRQPVVDALQADDPVLRETAILALKQLIPPQLYRRALRQQIANTDFPTVGRYAQAQLEAAARS